MPLDIQFDKIAQSYSAQRAHSPEVSAKIGQAIAALAGTNGLVLELGVGTGRIAHPAAAAGCRVIGIDLAHEMLRAAQADGERWMGDIGTGVTSLASDALSLVQGDVARLPFAPSSFDAVLAVHVLHLVPDWRGALAEVARVVKPHGLFLQGRDWRDPQSVAERLRAKLREAVMELVPGSRPPGAGAAIGQALAKLGGEPGEEVIAAEWTTHTAPAAILAGMAQRADAETWALDNSTLEAALARVRTFAEQTYADLDQPLEVAQRFVLNPVRFA